MSNQELLNEWSSSLQNNYGAPSIALSHGLGCEVWDLDGNRYLDFLGGIATNILGHAHPEIVSAVNLQVRTLNHVSNFYAHPQVVKLANNLTRLTGSHKARVFFCNSGAEANEAAIKLSRLTGRTKLLSCEGSFHGRTIGALSITGQVEKRKPFRPLLKSVKFTEFNNIKTLKRNVTSKTAALFIEPIQGERGVIPATKEFLRAARELTAAKGVLLVIDAVQTGMGRTGDWFGYEFSGIEPDVITLAKGLDKRAAITLTRSGNMLSVSSGGDSLTLSVLDSNFPDFKPILEAAGEPAALTSIQFNPKYFADLSKLAGKAGVLVTFGIDEIRPMQFTIAGERVKWQGAIMPMRRA